MRILASNPDTLGDMILRQPLYAALAGAGHELMLIVRPSVASIVPHVAPGAAVVELPYEVYAADVAAKWDLFEGVFRAARDFRPDVLLIAPYRWTLLEERLAAELPGVRRVGMGGHLYRGDPHAGPAPQSSMRLDVVAPAEEAQAEVEKNRALAAALLGADVPEARPALAPTEAGLAAARDTLARAGFEPGGYWVVCVTGTAHVSLKTWPAEKWARLLSDWSAARPDRKFLFVGLPAERADAQAVIDAMSPDAATRTAVRMDADGTLDELIALTSLAAGYAGHDTGPMHVAAAVGRPVLAVFGGGTWPRFVPAVEPSVSIVVGVPCVGCGWSCSFDTSHCIKDVPAADVLRAALDLEAGTVTGRETRPLEPGDALLKRMVREAAGRVQERVRAAAATALRLADAERTYANNEAAARAEADRTRAEAGHARAETDHARADAAAARGAAAAAEAARAADAARLTIELTDRNEQLAKVRAEIAARAATADAANARVARQSRCLADLSADIAGFLDRGGRLDSPPVATPTATPAVGPENTANAVATASTAAGGTIAGAMGDAPGAAAVESSAGASSAADSATAASLALDSPSAASSAAATIAPPVPADAPGAAAAAAANVGGNDGSAAQARPAVAAKSGADEEAAVRAVASGEDIPADGARLAGPASINHAVPADAPGGAAAVSPAVEAPPVGASPVGEASPELLTSNAVAGTALAPGGALTGGGAAGAGESAELAELRRQVERLKRRVHDLTPRPRPVAPPRRPWRQIVTDLVTGRRDYPVRPEPPMPRVTIVTPVLNAADDLRRTIESLLAQDYHDLQFIVVDGGSTDGTAGVLDAYRDRVDAVVSEPDAGPMDAIAKGFALARGDVIHFLFAGDVLEPGAVLRVAEHFRRRPRAQAVYYEDTVTTADGWRLVPAPRPRLDVYALLASEDRVRDGVWMRRDAYERIGRLRPALGRAADWDLWVRLDRRWGLRRAGGQVRSVRARPAASPTDGDAAYREDLKRAKPAFLETFGSPGRARCRVVHHARRLGEAVARGPPPSAFPIHFHLFRRTPAAGRAAGAGAGAAGQPAVEPPSGPAALRRAGRQRRRPGDELRLLRLGRRRDGDLPADHARAAQRDVRGARARAATAGRAAAGGRGVAVRGVRREPPRRAADAGAEPVLVVPQAAVR